MKLLIVSALAGSAHAFRHHGKHLVRASAARNATGLYGIPTCPCVGVDFGKETEYMEKEASHGYPPRTGSHCEAWDQDRDAECKGDDGAEHCEQPWCFVDPCHCTGTKEPPKQVHGPPLGGVVRQGIALYYSYSTCGGEDKWTSSHDVHACLNAKTEDECGEQDDCIWEESEWGAKCLGWEVAGLCGSIDEPKTWGLETCPCVGLNGINFTVQVPVGGDKVVYPADVGSVCKAWDNDHSPLCKGDDKAEGCNQPWCFVDKGHCQKEVKTAASTYMPGATYQGRPLHYSYAACGGKHPEEPAQKMHQAEDVKPISVEPKEAEPKGAEPEDAEPEAEEAEPEADDAASKEAGEEEAPAADVKYDHEKYNEEWHNEWRHGEAESFQDMHPEIKGFVDRQSDGVPSPVG